MKTNKQTNDDSGGIFLFCLQVVSFSVVADCNHAGCLLAIFCLESQPGHQQTTYAGSGESWEVLTFYCIFSRLRDKTILLLWCRPAGGAFLAAERRSGVCVGRPRLESHTRPAGEEAGQRGRVEDSRLVLYCSSAG